MSVICQFSSLRRFLDTWLNMNIPAIREVNRVAINSDPTVALLPFARSKSFMPEYMVCNKPECWLDSWLPTAALLLLPAVSALSPRSQAMHCPWPVRPARGMRCWAVPNWDYIKECCFWPVGWLHRRLLGVEAGMKHILLATRLEWMDGGGGGCARGLRVCDCVAWKCISTYPTEAIGYNYIHPMIAPL